MIYKKNQNIEIGVCARILFNFNTNFDCVYLFL